MSVRVSQVGLSVNNDALRTFARGALGRCPKCGQGQLFRRYLKVVDRCSACGEAYGHYRADDAPPWLTILLVGHITIPAILVVEEIFQPPQWVEFAVYLPLVLLLTLTILPRCKGIIIAALWRTKAEGSELFSLKEEAGPADASPNDAGAPSTPSALPISKQIVRNGTSKPIQNGPQ